MNAISPCKLAAYVMVAVIGSCLIHAAYDQRPCGHQRRQGGRAMNAGRPRFLGVDHAQDDLAPLMSRVVLRDQAAFRRLYDDTSQCLFSIVLRLLRDRAWAEEVLQEAYIAIWHAAPNYSAVKAQPMTWLMAIARYKAMDALRSTLNERRQLLRPTPGANTDDEDSDGSEVPDERLGPLDQVIQAVDSAQLRYCLQALEPQQRQAIALVYYDGLTHAELAAHMQQPLGTVKAWVRRGLAHLKPCLQDCAVEPGSMS